MEFALRRKTGYTSTYTLGMIFPSYRKGLLIQGSKGEWVAPIMVRLRLGSRQWIRVAPALVRFPSWVARKVGNLDRNGQVKR